MRRLVPRPVRRADLAVFRALARTEVPVLGPLLPRLSTAADRSRLWMVIAAMTAFAGGRSGRRAAIRGMVSIGVTSALVNLPAKLITGRVRPDLEVVPDIRRLARVPTSTSFPSGHSASAFAFATGMSLEEPRLRPWLLPLAAAVATSRVYTGVHYPGDALVGSAVGIAVARASTGPWPLATDQPATGDLPDGPVPVPGRDGTGLVLVANAGAGNALGPRQLEALRRALPGMRVHVAEPDEDLPATLRRAASDADALAVAGGNGTASAGAAAASEAGVPLALVPAGTLNHLAHDVGVEQPSQIVAAVRAGRPIRMDLGEIAGETFVNAASVGAYPHLVASRERLQERLGKWPATLWSGLRIVVGGDPIEVDLDGRRRRVWLLFIGNGRYIAEGVAPARRARLDEGVLDIRLVDAERPWARSRVLLSILTGRLGRSRSYERWTAREVHIRSRQGPLRLAVDGESRQGPEELTVRKRPGALLILQPPTATTGTTVDPDRYDAVLFDLDGVVTETAAVHRAAWKRLFDRYLRDRPDDPTEDHSPFTDEDYIRHVDGKPRLAGVRDFLASRGIHPAEDTVQALGEEKNRYFRERLVEDGVDVHRSTVSFVHALRSAGLRTAVFTSSRNGEAVLRRAGLEDLFETRVDGVVAAELDLPGKPDPAVLLEAARRIDADPRRSVVVEDAHVGVEAGRRGGFALVIGVDRGGAEQLLREHGADVVVRDLAEITVAPQRSSTD